jgi:hypothetical protein
MRVKFKICFKFGLKIKKKIPINILQTHHMTQAIGELPLPTDASRKHCKNPEQETITQLQITWTSAE